MIRKYTLLIVTLGLMSGLLNADIRDQPSLILRNAKGSLLSDFVASDNDLFFVGERGHFFHYDLKTEQSIQLQLPVRHFLTAIAKAPNNSLVIVGHDQLILHAGRDRHFRKVYLDSSAESPLFDVAFNEAGIGLAVGAYGVILTSEDWGKSWSSLSLEIDEPHIYQVKTRGNDFYLVGEWGTFIKLNGALELEKTYDVGSETTLFGLEFDANDNVFLYGLRGHLVQGDLLQDSFNIIPTDTTSSFFGSAVKDGNTYIFGSDGAFINVSSGKPISHSFFNKIDITAADFLGDKWVFSTTRGIQEHRE